MRIIAGSRKGHRIAAPKGRTTRPTSDFVREAAFNLIGPVDGATVIDETYNANPDSVRAAIDVLGGAAAPRLLVLGDMGEVGAHAERFHAEVGEYAKARGIDALLAAGPMMSEAVRAFGGGARHFATVDELLAALPATLASAPPSTVLVKGSRFMRMERVVAALRGAGAPAPAGAH